MGALEGRFLRFSLLRGWWSRGGRGMAEVLSIEDGRMVDFVVSCAVQEA